MKTDIGRFQCPPIRIQYIFNNSYCHLDPLNSTKDKYKNALKMELVKVVNGK